MVYRTGTDGESGQLSAPINRGNLVEQLLIAFPELQAAYEREASKWSPPEIPTNYSVVGFVFKPRFREEVESGFITDFLIRSGDFFERVSRTGDSEAVNVIWIKIFEWLLPRSDSLRLLWPILGAMTTAAIEDAAGRWGYSLKGVRPVKQ
jgi:hypothetical protein